MALLSVMVRFEAVPVPRDCSWYSKLSRRGETKEGLSKGLSVRAMLSKCDFQGCVGSNCLEDLPAFSRVEWCLRLVLMGDDPSKAVLAQLSEPRGVGGSSAEALKLINDSKVELTAFLSRATVCRLLKEGGEVGANDPTSGVGASKGYVDREADVALKEI